MSQSRSSENNSVTKKEKQSFTNITGPNFFKQVKEPNFVVALMVKGQSEATIDISTKVQEVVCWKIGDNGYKIDLPTDMNISNTFNIQMGRKEEISNGKERRFTFLNFKTRGACHVSRRVRKERHVAFELYPSSLLY